MLLANKKKGVSIMVGYLLLVVFVIIISVLVYTWLKSYVPAESIGCPEGVSISLDDYYLDCDNKQLNITVKNTGRFNYLGFFIHGSNDADQEIATIDFSAYLDDKFGKMTLYRNAISYLSSGTNRIAPGNTVGAVFEFSSETEALQYITLVPARLEEKDGRERFAICSDSLIRQNLECSTGDSGIIISGDCIPEDTAAACAAKGCGNILDSCGDTVYCDCDGDDVCNVDTCELEADCSSDDCSTFNYECGVWEICGVQTDCEVEISDCVTQQGTGYECDTETGLCYLSEVCGNDVLQEDAGEECDDGNLVSEDGCSDQCIIEFCGDGIIQEEIGEECDDGNTAEEDGCSPICEEEFGWVCDKNEPSGCEESAVAQSCNSYCTYLEYDGTPVAGDCQQNSNCPSGGTHVDPYPNPGDTWCTSPTGDYCCCQGSISA